MSRRSLIAAGAVLLVLLIGGPLLVTLTDDTKPEQLIPSLDAASQSAAVFLDGYVDADGRAVRRDRDGDTTATGQTAAMLVAAATTDRQRFDQVWGWAKTHLRLPDGTLAERWQGGAIVDRSPSVEADLQMVRALHIAARRISPDFQVEADAAARVVMARHVHRLTNGGAVLVPSTASSVDADVDVRAGDYDPEAVRSIGVLADSTTADALTTTYRSSIDQLVGGKPKDAKLASDWMDVGSSGRATALAAPGTSGQPVYSVDGGMPLSVRLAGACDRAENDQAERMWRIVSRSQDARTARSLTLSGSVTNGERSPLSATAAAGGAKAAQESTQYPQLLDAADQLVKDRPTFEGASWAALGRIMLTTSWLSTC